MQPIWRVVVSMAPRVINDPPRVEDRTLVVRADWDQVESLALRQFEKTHVYAHIKSVEYLAHELLDGAAQ